MRDLTVHDMESTIRNITEVKSVIKGRDMADVDKSRVMQIYHITSTDTEQIAWCLDTDSNTVCVRTPLIFSVLVEALTVDNPARGTLTDRSRNLKLTEDIFKNFLKERKSSLRSLSISQVEEVELQDIYFFQNGAKKPYLRVHFSSQKGYDKFRGLFQGREDEPEEEEIANDNDQETLLLPVEEEVTPDRMKQHRNVHLVSDGTFARFRILESDIAPYWHWLIHHGIRAASTIILPPESRSLGARDPLRISNAHREFYNVTTLKLSPGGDISTHPKILSWDIESLSENPSRFPNACSLGDVAFFISAYIKRYGDPSDKSRKVGIYLVDSLETLGLTEGRLEDGTELIIVQNEGELLDAFWNLIREEQPQVLLGYNTMGFDSRYLHHRMDIYQRKYPNLSLLKDSVSPVTSMRQFTWSSSAYKNVECWYYDSPGMLVLDLFVELKRSESLKAYTLEAVSEHFLNEHKVDLKAREMFNIYLEYQSGVRNDRTRAEMRRIAEYGMQDSVLPARLFDLRTQWVTYTQMACIMGVGIMDLITRGQTLRTKANIYRTARDMGFVINVPRDKPMFSGKFRGAYVCEMKAGLYDKVIVYDFSSLYPSTISAANLCYSTFLHPRDWHLYKPEQYTAFNVTMPTGEKKEVRYVKASVYRGILPRVVDGFLSARTATRALQKSEKDPIMWGILEKKQLAIKVSNNSVYGALGADFSSKMAALLSDVCASSLGLKWIAMTVTEIGQSLIKGCTAFLEKNYGAVPVYGDTDSTFVMVPPVEGVSLWKHAEKMGEEFNKTLTPPLKIELEKIIRMVGLTAKRYLYRCYTPAEILKANMNFKGVVATRRDTCKWQVQLFTAVSEGILQDIGKEEVTKIIYRAIIELMRGRVPLRHLLIGCSMAESYKSPTCPMAVLKQRMLEMGRPIAGGSRIEYFIVDTEIQNDDKTVTYRTPYWRGPKGGSREDTVSIRMRMIDEYIEGVTKIDYAYYVSHKAQKSIDQLFGAAFNDDCVIAPLVTGLRFDAEKTLKEMELFIGSS